MKSTLDHPETAENSPSAFPVTHSLLSTEALIAEVAKAYKIGTDLECELLQPGPNDTYLFTSPSGRYVGRVYGASRRSVSEIRYELQLLEHLASKGISVSLPIAAGNGETMHPLAAPEGLRQLVLFRYAEGNALSWSREDHAQLAGRVVGAIHAAADGFASPDARFTLDLTYLIDSPLRAIRPFLTQAPEDLRFAEHFAGRLRSRVEEAIARGLDWGVCHGDVSDGNIRIAADGSWTVIDFDMSGPGWRIFDFVPAHRIAVWQKSGATWEAFVRGYGESRFISEADLSAVDLFHAISRLWSLGTRARIVNLRGTTAMTSYLQSHLAFYREWDADHG